MNWRSRACLFAIGLSGLLGLTTTACQPEGPGDLTPVATRAHALSTWPTGSDGVTTVPVCWTFSGYDTDKAYVKAAVEAGWGATSSLKFTHWGLCDSSVGSPAIRVSRTTGAVTESHSVDLSSSINLNFTYPSTYNPTTNEGCECPPYDLACAIHPREFYQYQCDKCDSQHSFCDGQYALFAFGKALQLPASANTASLRNSSGGFLLNYNGGLITEDVAAVKAKYGVTPLRFSNTGALAGYSCVQLKETQDPDGWSDNYLCTNGNQDIRWSSAGAISGMRCTQITNATETTNHPSHTWSDNYVCVPATSPLQFTWYEQAAVTPTVHDGCVRFGDSLDPDGWANSYLCYTSRYWFSSSAKNAGQNCLSLNEPSDPDSWSDNFLCSDQSNEDITWNTSGAITGKKCTQITEPSEASSHGWSNNFMCVASGSPINFTWRYNGPLTGKTCVRFYETADPDTWTDNYLCY